MLGRVKQWMRRRVRGWQWGDLYPVVLPHVKVEAERWVALHGSEKKIGPGVRDALKLADGSRSIREIAAMAQGPAWAFADADDDDVIALWHSAIGEEAKKEEAGRIILSPHPDDAALSCGGELICEQLGWGPKGKALIVNFFTRVGWWRLEASADVDRISAVRAAEETLVGRMLGAEVRMLGLPEAPLRGHGATEVFSARADERDREVARRIEEEIARLVDELGERATWHVPLGVGGHLDHRIVRDAALVALRGKGVPTRRIVFYEEQPYAAEQGGVNDYGELVEGMHLGSRLVDVSKSIRWKLELCRVYWSQLDWGRIGRLGAYARRLKKGSAAERYWGE